LSASWRILTRHILPNIVGIVVVQAAVAAAGLGFLGMDAQPLEAEWGAMPSKARDFMRIHPILSIAPGVMIMITVLSLNFIYICMNPT
jgi:ABC-type dipeptide/oligopeptide/nickel transport system permease subunit